MFKDLRRIAEMLELIHTDLVLINSKMDKPLMVDEKLLPTEESIKSAEEFMKEHQQKRLIDRVTKLSAARVRKPKKR